MHWNRNSAWIAVVVLVLASPAVPAETIRIGAWNLAFNTGNHRNANHDELIRRIAEGIALFEPDVLGLSEVESEAVLDELAEELENAHNLEYDVAFVEHEQHLNLGVLHKRSIVAGRLDVVVGTGLGHLEDRHRPLLEFELTAGDFDFVLFVAHFKSGGDGIDARIGQTSALAAYLSCFRHGDEQDYILVGDYNMTPRRDSQAYNVLSAEALLRPIAIEELCTGNACLGTHIGRRNRLGNMLDGYAFSQGAAREYRDGSFQRVNLPQLMGLTLRDFKRQVSDHYPLMAEFETAGPDDD